ncbi:hypothetical protein N566_02530 [Streptomycetaceae bacterium MP113-05]|nr:hypothetical protein N566_02530 [Streptomycetaceae bacterium MP113-05]
MNDRHPAGEHFPADPGAEYSYSGYGTANHDQSAYGSYGTAAYATATQHDGWSTGSYDAQTAGYSHDNAYYGATDPLYGPVPGGDDLTSGGYPASSHYGGDYGGYDADGYHPDAHGYAYGVGPDPDGYGANGYGTPSYDQGAYDTAAWTDATAAGFPGSAFVPHQPGAEGSEHGWSAPAEGSVQWDVSAFDATALDATTLDGPALDPSGLGTAHGSAVYGGADWDGAAYSHQDGYDAVHGTPAHGQSAHETTAAGFHEQPTATFDAYQASVGTPEDRPAPEDLHDDPGHSVGAEAESEPGVTVAGPQGRGRRRSPKPRRSALLTVAAPSVAVLGVAGIAAASVIPAGDEDTAQAAPDTTTEVKASPANSKLDTQLAGLREAGDDFADRASRTQERIDLKKRQEAERKRKAAEAARREALRPKFALPVEGAGISAYFGQAGINWMSVHTGIDFPVSYGTPVKAATDGTVRTQWNSAYGNMMIVTSPDGTETWYCHLGSTRIRSGSVKAGDVIGYSGSSGNSTGPHLHFEVRPGGGSAIDPLSWFRSHGLEPS